MAEISRTLTKNTALQVVGKGIGTLISLATFAVLYLHLQDAGYGQFTVALNFAAMFAVIVDFGFTLIAAQMISEPGADEEKLLGNMFTLRLLSAFIFLGGASVLVFFFPYTIEVKIAAAVACASFFFASASWMFVGVFQKRLNLTWAILSEQANRLLVLIGAIMLLQFAPSIILTSVLFVLGAIAQLVLTLFAVGRHLEFKPQVDVTVWATIISRSWPIGVSILFNLIYLRGDILFMSLLGTPDAEIGLYGAAYKMVDVLTTVPVMFMGLMLPLLTLAWAQRNRTAFQEHLQRSVDGLAIMAIPFAFGCAVVGGDVLALIDESLVNAGPILAILGLATGAIFFNSIFGHTIVALHKQKPMILGYAFTAVMAVIGYWVLIPRMGALGAAWVTLASEVLIGMLTAGVVFATSRVTLSPTPSLRALGASILMFAALLVVHFPNVLLQILWGVGVYFAALALLGGPSPLRIMRLFLPERPRRV